MATRKKSSSASAACIEVLCNLLSACMSPVTPDRLRSILMLSRTPALEEFTRMTTEELQAICDAGVKAGRILACADTRSYSVEGIGWEALCVLYSRPEYAQLPLAVASAIPVMDGSGHRSSTLLRRDLMNAFFSGNIQLLNQVSTELRYIEQDPSSSLADIFDFLYVLPQEWLCQRSKPFLDLCAAYLLPISLEQLQDIRPLAERLYSSCTTLQATCNLLDYYLLCGGESWKKLKSLFDRIHEGEATRSVRLAITRFFIGQDSKACDLFSDALALLRRNSTNRTGYFSSIGGVFMVLAQLRRGDNDTALRNAHSGATDLNPFVQVYELLEQIADSRLHPELPVPQMRWQRGEKLCNFFCCVAQYWMEGTLSHEQAQMLTEAAEYAEDGGYQWLYEECRELQHRIAAHDRNSDNRFHDPATGHYPFMLDCVLPQNHWLERLKRMQDALNNIPSRNPRRLAWNIKIDGGVFTATPLEQRLTRGHWSHGSTFKGYLKQNWENITEDIEVGICDFEMLSQDKHACYILKSLPSASRPAGTQSDHSVETTRLRWAQLFQALVGHPRIYLDGSDTHQLKCLSAQPYIEITVSGDNLRYTLYPASDEHSHLAVRLEQGENLCVYEFDSCLQHLRELLGSDFQIPRDMAADNAGMILKLWEHYSLSSYASLDFLNLKFSDRKIQFFTGDATPVLQLLPGKNGLHVEMMVLPFLDSQSYYYPGEGPLEKLFFLKGNPARIIRVMKDEVSNAQAIIDQCPQLHHSLADAVEQGQPANPWIWDLEANDSYELSLKLRELSDHCRIQWPEDKRFICRRTLTISNISLRTDSYQNWFGIDGNVKLDDSASSLSLTELIQSAVIEKKHFISLSDGQIVALSDELRHNLEELNRLGSFDGVPGEGLRISKFLLPFIGETLGNFTDVQHHEKNQGWLKRYSDIMKKTPKSPSGLKATLRPYQRDGFTWLMRLDGINAGACLADDMGLGKTIQAIALLLSRSNEGPSLIIAPTSVCSNWYNEITRFAPSLHCVLFGSGDRIASLKQVGPGTVMIATYGLLQSEQEAFRKTHWRIAVLDEAQAIKNSHAKRSRAALEIDADFRVVTTGTPVENNLSEMWSIFNFIIPGLLGRREEFQHKYAAAIEREGSKEAAEQLRKLVSPFLLRRRKDQVLTDLPPKQDIEYPITLSEGERAFYDNLRHQIAAGLEDDSESLNKHTDRVLRGITMLCEAVDHPAMVTGAGGENLGSSKLEAFLELLKELLANDHKVLVFSRYVKFLEIVCRSLDENKIRYMYLDGNQSTGERSRAIEGFQKGEAPVFVISLQAGGLGLNLTAADYVIHLDSWWNPAVENQASDRAHRLGQQRPVTVYHLRCKDTIEEKILKLHQRKQNLADQMLANTDDIANKTTIEELRQLICD